MVRSAIYQFEAEIRDTQDHASTDDPDADAEFTVNTDSLHPNTTYNYDSFVVYVEDTHDNEVTTTIQSTAGPDADWSMSVDEGTVSGTGKQAIAEQMGRVRVVLSASTAPTSGSVTVSVHALGRE